MPSLWDRIDEYAQVAGVPANRVIENTLMERFGMAVSNRETVRTNHRVQLPDELEVE